MGNTLLMNELDAPILSAFERWLLKRGWRGNVIKKIRSQSKTGLLSHGDDCVVRMA